ncbi:hypothetical protein JW314_22455 [Enterobacter roggenkampii]|nr:ClbS/DfsB family four-helix bundle protein [Enterobacter bugandensis]MBW4222709.1 hypothetical protein [Enterobacter roggenkampii]HCR0817974.1 hypothetical protein [Enterobacter hormaechei]
MSVADLVAYLVGWNLLVLIWCDGKVRACRSIFLKRATDGTRWESWRRSSTPTMPAFPAPSCCSSSQVYKPAS